MVQFDQLYLVYIARYFLKFSFNGHCHWHHQVHVYEYFETAEFMYLVLEHCGAGTLHSYICIKQHSGLGLPEDEARRLFVDLCYARSSATVTSRESSTGVRLCVRVCSCVCVCVCMRACVQTKGKEKEREREMHACTCVCVYSCVSA